MAQLSLSSIYAACQNCREFFVLGLTISLIQRNKNSRLVSLEVLQAVTKLLSYAEHVAGNSILVFIVGKIVAEISVDEIDTILILVNMQQL